MSIATDKNRYPTLTPDGKKLMNYMREHPSAPIFRNKSGNRLTESDLLALADHEIHVKTARVRLSAEDWMPDFIDSVYADVPFYRALGSAPKTLRDVPVISRAELSADIARFVPDSVSTKRMMHFQTSGTTGHPLLVPSHPQVAGRYLSYHKRALARFGIVPRHGKGQVGVILLGFQKKCFTYLSVTPQMNESGLAKINLHPNDWNDPNHRATYIDEMAPEIIAGDPISFAELLRLPVKHRPRALMSVAMMLTDGLRAKLETQFGCPVLDIYSMNEVGPIGVFDPHLDAHVLLQDKLFIETLRPDEKPSENGERGDIVVSGGFNFCLPLLRYRTGDTGILSDRDGGPVIEGLHGRQAVKFLTGTGEWINNVDVSHALKGLAMPQFGLHQNADGSLLFYAAPDNQNELSKAEQILATIFGNLSLDTRPIQGEGKQLQYTSDLEPEL
jgi:phenylacetate-CoA ligase